MSRYLEDLADVFRAAGLTVIELEGWQRRGRSNNSPYADGRPWCVMWHHTASSGDGAWDAQYCTFSAPDAPLTNVVIGRDGIVHVCAGGPTNTNGKGGPLTFSRGVVPIDSMNSYAIAFEISGDGVGMPYPTVQIDACFTASLAVTAAYDLEADDVAGHADWAPSRKIDPATADAVQGPWQPADVNSSGTWSLFDLRAECSRRAGTSSPPPTGPPPTPTHPGKVRNMYVLNVTRHGWPAAVTLVMAADGVRWPRFDITWSIDLIAGAGSVTVSKEQLLEMLYDRPGIGPCPFADIPEYADADLAAAW
jgi:hypothetical protein